MNEQNPLISVILPVYNVESYLIRCLDSLVQQTYENLEIIAVDDGSTDSSGAILDNYAARYPGKLSVVHTPNQGQGAARNLAMSIAHGEFFGFCDADDYFSLNAFEKMYQQIEKRNLDLLYVPVYRVKNDVRYILGELPTPVTKSSLLLNMTMYTFYEILARRELFEKAGDIPDILYEDIAYIPVVVSYAENPGYHPKAYYYYVDREDSTVHRTKETKILDILKAIDFAIEHGNPEFRNEITMCMASKCVEKIKSLWYYADIVLLHYKTLRDKILNNPFYLADPLKYKQAGDFLNLPDTPFPKTMYLNDFKGSVNKELITSIQTNGWRDTTDAEIILLNETNCDIYENPEVTAAYENNDLEWLAGYFALKSILSSGGVYLANCLELSNPFDGLRYFPSFVGYEDKENFTDKAFGGRAGDPVLTAIWNTYETEPAASLSLSERIKEVLVHEYDVKLKGNTNYVDYPVVLLSPSVLLSAWNTNGHVLCQRIDYENESTHDLITLKRTTLQTLANSSNGWRVKQQNNLKYQISELEKTRERLKADIQTLKSEKKEILHSEDYRMIKSMKKSRIGRLLLKIYQLWVQVSHTKKDPS